MIWNWIKYNIRAHAIQYSKRKAKQRGKKEHDLQEELTKAKSKLESNPNNHNKTYYNSDNLKQIFKLPHSIVVESYVKAFQYKVINSILYTNTKLYKISFRT